MRLFGLRSLLLVPCLAAILTVGCQGNAQLNPTAPTGPLGSTALTTDAALDMAATASNAGDVIVFARGGGGNGNGNGNGGSGTGTGTGNGKDKDKGGDSSGSQTDEVESESQNGVPGGPGHDNRGQLSGFVTAVTGDTLTVRGITVMVDPETTVIRHGNRTLTIDDIHVGDHVQARGTMEGTTLEATEIKVENTAHDNDEVEDDDGAEVQGKVSELGGTGCPSVTFKVGNTSVTTSDATTFTGVECSALANGVKVEVEGTLQANGSIAATSVELD